MVGDGFDPCGGASIYKRIDGNWTEKAYLQPYEECRSRGYGFAVALDTSAGVTTAIVGSPLDSSVGIINGGAAFVYDNSNNGTEWNLQAKVTASDGKAFDDFGWSVDINGDFAMISASVSKKGHTYVYRRQGTSSWEQMSRIDSPVDEDYFGHSVSIADKTAVVGGYGYTYIFAEFPQGTWSLQDKLTRGSDWTGEKSWTLM